MNKNFLFLVLFLGLTLTGCSSPEEVVEQQKISNVVLENKNDKGKEDIQKSSLQFFSVEEKNYSPTLSLSGTVVAKEEVTISAEVSGIVSEVWKKEGEKVKEGERILMLDTGNNLVISAYNAAKVAKMNAKASLDLYLQSARTEITNAKIASEQAQSELERAKRTQKIEKNSISAQVENTESQYELAQKNLDIAKIALQQTLDNEKKLQENLLEITGNTLSQTLVNFRSSMNMTDELLGASEINKKTNDEFEVYLEGTTEGVLLPTQDLWRKTNPKILQIERDFRSFEKDKYSYKDEEKMISLTKQTIENAKNVRKILRNIENMLKESIASPTFPQSKIDTLKAQIVQHQNILEQNISQITSMEQKLSDFHIQSPQRITNAKMRVSVAESQTLATKQSFVSLKNSGISKVIGVDSALDQAKKRYRAALNQVKSAEIKTQLSIQGAKAQYDSASAQLSQAEISLSKLTLRSGINGTITKILKKEGDTISVGTPMVIVADYSSLKLKGDVSVSDRLKISEGMKAEVKIDDIDQVFDGEVSLIYPEADKITKRVSVEITIPNTIHIPANIFATAKIILKKEKDRIFVPRTAVFREKVSLPSEKDIYQNFVYLVEDSLRAHKKCSDATKKICYFLKKQKVEKVENYFFDPKDDNFVEILSGLKDNDIIIKSVTENFKSEWKEGDELEVSL